MTTTKMFSTPPVTIPSAAVRLTSDTLDAEPPSRTTERSHIEQPETWDEADRDANTPLSAVGERDRRQLLETALATVNLTPSQACLVVDALYNHVFDLPNEAPFVGASVGDAIRLEGLGAKYDLSADEAKSLVATMRALTVVQTTAVVDAVERLRALPDAHVMDLCDGACRVGLLRR